MTVLTSQLPSGGYGYSFPSVEIKPFTFLELNGYLENVPSDPLEKYVFDIKVLCKDDPKVYDLYVMDLDFLIFFKKLCTVSADLSYNLTIKCPDCGNMIKKKVTLDQDIHFTQIDDSVMDGAVISINNHKYNVQVPNVRDFLQVMTTYLRYRKITDLKMIKTISLITEFRLEGNQVEADILGATHNDITLLLALRELYFERVEPIKVFCNECGNKTNKYEERRGISVSVDSLIGDFFREIINNSPIDGSKVLFK